MNAKILDDIKGIEPSDITEVERQQIHLGESIENLANRISNLEMRLNPFLKDPTNPQVEKCLTNPDGVESKVGVTLRDMRERIESFSQYISSLEQRL